MTAPRRGEGRGRSSRLPRPTTLDAVDLELEHHIAERTERLIEEGWDPEEARREALRLFGNRREIGAELQRESARTHRERWMMGGLDALLQDLRYALRGIRRQRGFALTLIATLAIGIGVTGGIFSIFDAVLLRPVPFVDAEELVEIRAYRPDRDRWYTNFQRDRALRWIEAADFFDGIGLWDRTQTVRTDAGPASNVTTIVASANLDDLLGLTTVLGRGLVEEDQTLDRRVAVLSWAYWRETGGDPDIVGSTIELDGERWQVVGVFDAAMKFPTGGGVDLWIPYGSDGSYQGSVPRAVRLVGRLPDGLSIEGAEPRIEVIAGRLAEANPEDEGWTVRLSPAAGRRANTDTARGLWLMGAGAVLMLLIAVVNGVNLLLVRGHARLAEVGVRKALGASGARIVRQVLLETAVISLCAGGVATAVAWGTVEAIDALAPSEVTFLMVHEFGLDGRALAAIFGVTALVALLVGVLPGLRLTMARVAGSGSATGVRYDRSSARLRSGLVSVEIAVSVVLLVGAGLFLRSYSEMSRVDLGMATEELALLTVQLPPARFPSDGEWAAFASELLAELQRLPEARAVSLGVGAPPRGGLIYFGRQLRGEGEPEVIEDFPFPAALAGPGYLETLGARLVEGRDFQAGDRESGNVIIDRDFAELLFGGKSALGRRFTPDESAEEVEWFTVVGVVEEFLLGGPDERIGPAALIEPMDLDRPGPYQLYALRTAGDPEALLPAMRAAVADVDPQLPLVALETGRQAFAEELTRPRFIVLLFSILSAVALLLSAIGTYGVIAFAVRQREREMGIRMALGAPAGSVRGRVLRWGASMALVGTTVGVGVAVWADRFVAELLFRVSPGDPVTLVAVVATMIGVTLLACLVPALRATRIDPVEVLRAE